MSHRDGTLLTQFGFNATCALAKSKEIGTSVLHRTRLWRKRWRNPNVQGILATGTLLIAGGAFAPAPSDPSAVINVFQRIVGWWGARTAPRRVIHLDDEPSDTEVLPLSALEWCREEFTEIAAFSARHERGDSGWSDIHVRSAAPRTVDDLSIPMQAAIKALSARLPRLDAVLTASSSNPQTAKGAVAFGPSPLAAVVLTAPDGPMVKFLEVFIRSNRDEARALLSALPAIPSPEPLLVADWRRGIAFRPDRAQEVAAWLDAWSAPPTTPR